MESLNIISLGLGLQSTCLYFMSCMNELPRADQAIFADTGKEKKVSYEYLIFLQQWRDINDGIPIIECKTRNLFQDLLSGSNSSGKRFASIPCFTQTAENSTGMLRRQCTREYKIGPVNDAIRNLYGLRKGQHRPKTFVWQGITLDEIERMSRPIEKWKVNVYPFCGYMVFPDGNTEKLPWAVKCSRNDLAAWYEKHALPAPSKSACVFCPYHSDHHWSNMKNNHPEDFAAAVQVDNAIRNSATKGIRNPCFLHRSLKPLSEVVFDPENKQRDIECSGTCHV